MSLAKLATGHPTASIGAKRCGDGDSACSRVQALYVQRRQINRLHTELVERFQTLPPIPWLPVLRDEDGAFVTMADAGWARRAAVAFLAAFLGVDEWTIRRSN